MHEDIITIKMIVFFVVVFIVWLFIVIETIHILYVNFYKNDSKNRKSL